MTRTAAGGVGTTRMRVAALALVLAAASACSSRPQVSSGAPPLTVCAQILNDTPSGAVIEDASAGPVTVTSRTSGAGIYLLLARGCSDGSSLAIPAGVATVTETARTRDGRLAAVGITPLRQHFAMTVTNAAGRTYAVTVTL